jgi:hypothetical protein
MTCLNRRDAHGRNPIFQFVKFPTEHHDTQKILGDLLPPVLLKKLIMLLIPECGAVLWQKWPASKAMT